MTQQIVETDHAIIPRPDATPASLRAAIARVRPSSLREFDQQLLEASTEAQAAQNVGPLRVFCASWAMYVEIQRFPLRAQRLAALEHMVDTGHPDTRSAVREIAELLREASEDLGQ
ncbi:hypothetical protein LG943_20170 [Streptomonospora sp. S1-112]|uniref:Uncharacterized protein n=1 Tax=Streptomonospora mangrovi TaxID=2883123 RepID=A0A9X3SIS3_9ACTN|nr:DUF6247 family protein [Streptomonospora mangrovi]MDA0566609.1 hypothetical protein [Streptomonospora mangrovi]